MSLYVKIVQISPGGRRRRKKCALAETNGLTLNAKVICYYIFYNKGLKQIVAKKLYPTGLID